MIKIHIQGLKDGLHEVDLSVPVEAVPEMLPEFIGDINLKGNLRIIGKRYYFQGKVSCNASLICDMSLIEYVENISFDIALSFLAVNPQRSIADFDMDKKAEERIVADDEKYLDITEDIREELAVHLPMKRIAPQFAGKEFEDIYPQYSSKVTKKPAKTKIVDDRWAPLQNLKLN
jgi:uncharacterized metal-binding protein YceD (DUF177 family)